jgi:hypothetical protein
MKPGTETKTAPLTVIGVDIGKEVFHLVGLGIDGKTAFRRRIRWHTHSYVTRSFEGVTLRTASPAAAQDPPG